MTKRDACVKALRLLIFTFQQPAMTTHSPANLSSPANADPGHGPSGFSPIEVVPGRLDTGVLFLCDHASNAMPAEYGTLGLSEGELKRHIAWDIGAADVTRALAAHFGAPAVLTRFSRLLIDPNRGADDPTLVMRLSDGAIIPGNLHTDAAEVERRTEHFWRPYRTAVASVLDDMIAAGAGSGYAPAVVSLHSFTHIWRGQLRPWHLGLLWDSDPRLAAALWRELAHDPSLCVGDNDPYDGALVGDTMYENCTMRGLAHVLIELRQDLIDAPQKAREWADRLAAPLAKALAGDDIHTIEHHASRAGTGQKMHLPEYMKREHQR